MSSAEFLLKEMRCFSISVDSYFKDIEASSLLSIRSKKNFTSSLVIFGWICLKNYENCWKLSYWYPLKPRFSSSRFISILRELIWKRSSVITILSLSSKCWFCSAYWWKYPWKIGCMNTSSQDIRSFSWTRKQRVRKSFVSALKAGLTISGFVSMFLTSSNSVLAVHGVFPCSIS